MPETEENDVVEETIDETVDTDVTDEATEEADEETAAGSEGTEDGADAEEDDSDDEDSQLGARAQKRIKKLIAEKKEATAKFKYLTKQLEEAKKLSGDDGKAIMAAAEASGILPGLMTKDDAEAQKKIGQYKRIIDRYEQWLEDHDVGDEFDCGDGKMMSYGKVERRVNQLSEVLRDLKSEYGPRQKELRSKVREIFELGTAALKAGWKPGQKKVATTGKNVETRPTNRSSRIKPETGIGRAPEDIEVENGDDLEAFIVASNRRRKK